MANIFSNSTVSEAAIPTDELVEEYGVEFILQPNGISRLYSDSRIITLHLRSVWAKHITISENESELVKQHIWRAYGNCLFI